MTKVIECTSSFQAWTALQAAYSDSSASRTHHLREELLSLHRGDLSIDDYGRKFKSLCDKLSAIGRPVDDAGKGHWFLRGLGIQFSSFADTRLSLSPVPNFRSLLNQAKQYESMLWAMEGPPSPNVTFLVLRGSAGRPSSNSARGIIGPRPSSHGPRSGGSPTHIRSRPTGSWNPGGSRSPSGH